MGIPTDVAVRLMVNPAAFAVADPFFQAVASAGFALTCAGINRGPVTGDREVFQVDQSFFNGLIQEQGLEDSKETPGWSEILGRIDLKPG